MKKVMLMLAVVGVFGLTACEGFNESPEQKAFHAFLAKCKANPSTPDCVEYAKPQGQ